MNRDFTLIKYGELCDVIVGSDYVPLTIEKYIEKEKPEKFIILRHDVDIGLKQAVNMARIEYEYDIASTYYFRMTKEVFQPHIIKQIADLGHEVGYHYEVLDKAKGNVEQAIKIFKQELNKFRAFVDVKTICMHGNPFTSWTNRDLWREYDFRDFGIIGEPYLSIDYNQVLYLTDTGRTWSGKYSVKDIVDGKFYKVKSTDDVINLIKSGHIPKKCLSVHPSRWNDEFCAWLKELVWQSVKNIGKAGILYRRKFS